ncbi:MAG: ribose transport system permease protein [Solirubrobacteraceae bacterium]|jgi:ribose transport system permease protein|nr:ribose transport system permease protein [Solirubrobacteraceae bacterium]
MTSALRSSLSSRDAVAPLCLVASGIAFGLMAPGFLDLGNGTNLLGQMAPLAIVALGQMVVIVTGGFDVSVGAVAALSAVTGALLANAIGPVGLIAAPLVGLALGLVNGVVVGRLRVPPIIATLGMLSVARGLALLVSHGEAVVLRDGNPLSWLGYGLTAGVPNALLLTLVILAGLTFLMARVRLGRRFYMLGSDREAAQLVGVGVRRTEAAAYAIAGLAAGIAALVFVGRAGAGLPTEGDGLELAAIAAAVIGGTALTGGIGRPLFVVLGALFVQSLSNGLNLAGTEPFVREVILGAVIVMAGLVDWLIRRAAASQHLRGEVA